MLTNRNGVPNLLHAVAVESDRNLDNTIHICLLRGRIPTHVSRLCKSTKQLRFAGAVFVSTVTVPSGSDAPAGHESGNHGAVSTLARAQARGLLADKQAATKQWSDRRPS